uniref:Uncharacterized protein n=1 Tax=Romanomermis culicivorax TaxID=13658 RepID=A0A915IP33_ROMCU
MECSQKSTLILRLKTSHCIELPEEMRHIVTERKKNFRSIRLEVTVGHFPQNCSYPFRSKVDFQAERFKLWRSVPSSRKRQVIRCDEKQSDGKWMRFLAEFP